MLWRNTGATLSCCGIKLVHIAAAPVTRSLVIRWWRAPGNRIVWSDLDPDRVYAVAFGQDAMVIDGVMSTAPYGYARRTGRIETRPDGRVLQAAPGSQLATRP